MKKGSTRRKDPQGGSSDVETALIDAVCEHQRDLRENYGKVANAVDAAMAEQDRVCKAFDREGWDGDEEGWCSPSGISHYDWEHDYGLPLPSDPEWESYKAQKRTEHGWKLDDSGWYAPCGKHETEVSGLAPEYIL